MTRTGRAGADAVEGAPAAGPPPAANGSPAARNRKHARTGWEVEERRDRRHRDRPSQTPVTSHGYRGPTFHCGPRSRIRDPSAPPRAASKKDRPDGRADGVVPLGPGAVVRRRGPCRRLSVAVRKVLWKYVSRPLPTASQIGTHRGTPRTTAPTTGLKTSSRTRITRPTAWAAPRRCWMSPPRSCAAWTPHG